MRVLSALLIAVRNDTGLVAIQRLFLDPLTGGKRDMEDPRRTLGRPQDGAARHAPAGPVLGLAEGYETARAAMQQLGLPVWATLGAERFDRIGLPHGLARLVLLPDRGRAGEAAAARALAAYCARGVTVEVRRPPAGGSDWADALGRGGEGERRE